MSKTNMSKPRLLAEIAGWYGTFAIMTGYILVSFDVIAGNSLLYQLLNLSGAIGVVTMALTRKVYQSAVLNIFWALIAISALVNSLIR